MFEDDPLPISSHLERGAREWPDELVVPPDLAAMRRVAQGLPWEVAGIFAECHLSLPRRSDLVARVVARDRRALLERGVGLESAREFLRLWCDERHPAYVLPAIDIEWDAGAEAPFVCPYFEPDLIRGHRAIAARGRREAAAGSPRLALSHGPPVLRALDPLIPDSWLERLTECVEALPDHGVLIPGWSQRKRPGGAARAALRVIIALPRHALPSYLEALPFRGSISEALASMKLLRPSSPWIGFDADIDGDGLGERLGFYQEHQTLCAGDPELGATLNRLELEGLCEPARLRGLRAWVARRAEQPEPGQGRSLSLKLVTAPGQRTTVKAYVSTFDVPIVMRQSEDAVSGRSSARAPSPWPN